MRWKGASSKRPAIFVFKPTLVMFKCPTISFAFQHIDWCLYLFFKISFWFFNTNFFWCKIFDQWLFMISTSIKPASGTTFEGGEANLCRDGHWNLWATPYRCTSLQIWQGAGACKGRQLWWLEWVGISGFFDTKTWTRNQVEIFPEIERMSEVSWCIRSLRSLID